MAPFDLPGITQPIPSPKAHPGMITPPGRQASPLFGATALLDKYDPSTGKILAQYPIASTEAVQKAIADSRAAGKIWQATPLKTRSKVLQEMGRQIQAHADELSKLISQETGKPLKESLESDLTSAVSLLNYYAKIGPRWLKPKRLPLDKSAMLGRIHYQQRNPKGIVAVISPWNYPVAIPSGGIAAALMGGNTVVFKPSEQTPATGMKLAELFQNALEKYRLPKEIVQVLVGNGTTGKALIEGNIDYTIFTGGTVTGNKVRQAMQVRGKEASLELGGSDPMIILPGTRDLDAVTSYALWGRFTNTGQSCGAVKRLFVHHSQLDTVVGLLKTKIEALRQGNPTDPANHIGPVISESQLKALESQVQDALDKGATLVTGGKRKPDSGYFYEPTLLTQVPNGARVLKEEVFGPVLPVISYQTIDEAVAMANDSDFGLTASVFGNTKEAQAVANRLEVGSVSINDIALTNFAFPVVPWHGVKHSGPGTSHSALGLLDTTHLKTVTVNLLHYVPFFRKPFWAFSKGSADIDFSKSGLKAFGPERWIDKLRPSFLWGALRNRSAKKL